MKTRLSGNNPTRQTEQGYMGIKDWKAERISEVVVAVREVQLRPRGQKGPQLTAVLYDSSGSRMAKSWNLPPVQVAHFQEAATCIPPLVRVSGTVEASGNYAGELTLTEVSLVEPTRYDLNDFLEALPEGHPVLVEGLDRLIGLVHEPHLAGLLAETIGVIGRFRAEFVTATAARKNHHAYRGGLLRHSLELAELALRIAEKFPGAHPDMLITAALLHDIGKLWEMDHEWRQGAYTMEGTLLGHIFLGAERIGEICGELQFPMHLRIALQHILLAHHDNLAFGSPVRPMLPEAIVIAKCDQISAELTACLDATQERQPGQQIAWKGDRAFFVGQQDWRKSPLLPVVSANDPEEQLLQRLLATASSMPRTGLPYLRLPEDEEDFFGI